MPPIRLIAPIALLLWAGQANIGQGQPLSRYAYQHPQMGTLFRLVLYAADSVQAGQAAAAAFARIDALNAKLSDYRAESELSRLGRSSDSTSAWVAVSPDMEAVLRQAQAISTRTEGAFDITIGPLSRLWRRAFRQGAFPDNLALAEARERVGCQNLQLHPDEPKVKFLRPGMRLDAGGIAKGYAVDEAMKVLQQQGITIALVDGGGDLWAGAPPPGESGWKVEVQGDTMLTIANCAIATPGDAYRYLEWQGRRYSHIIDPRTGLGVSHGKQVTVLAPNCTLADALASALSVEPGLEISLEAVFQDCSFRIKD